MLSRLVIGRRVLGVSAVANLATTNATAQAEGHTQNPLKGKVVLITGATAGIGKVTAFRFAELDTKLVLVGRRTDKLHEVKAELARAHPSVKVHVHTLDVGDIAKVLATPSAMPAEFQDVSVLVNNAGLALGVASVDTNDMDDAHKVMQTNVHGLIAMCRAFLPGMKQRNEGHIINIGSIAGLVPYATGTLYCASKFAVKGFTDAARHDLAGTPIRVTHISPGLVAETEFSVVRMAGDVGKAKAVYADIEALKPEDVADNIIYAATRPKHVQIAEITMFATNQSGPRDLARVGPSLGATPKS